MHTYSSSGLPYWDCGAYTLDLSSSNEITEISMFWNSDCADDPSACTSRPLLPSSLLSDLADWNVVGFSSMFGEPAYVHEPTEQDLDAIKASGAASPELIEYLSSQKSVGWHIGILIQQVIESEGTRVGFLMIGPSSVDIYESHPEWTWALCRAVADSRVSMSLAERYPSWPIETLSLVSNGTLDEWEAARHPEWEWRQIAQRRVQIGMTTDEVLRSWGEPRSKTTRITVSGRVEIWQYSSSDLGFMNGLLVLIESTR